MFEQRKISIRTKIFQVKNLLNSKKYKENNTALNFTYLLNVSYFISYFTKRDGAISVLQIGADFRDYRFGQEGLQIGPALEILNRGKKISNWGRDYKSGQEGFQIGAGITNRCRHRNLNRKFLFFGSVSASG